jgi:putative heme transporter
MHSTGRGQRQPGRVVTRGDHCTFVAWNMNGGARTDATLCVMEPRRRASISSTSERGSDRLRRAGSVAWALLGIALMAVVVMVAASQVSLVLVATVLALFPATLLAPVARWLQARGVPAAIAALVTVVAGLALLAGVIGAMVPLVRAELPSLMASAGEGLDELFAVLRTGPLDLGVEGLEDLVTMASEQFADATDQVAEAAISALEVVTASLLLLVSLFFYLKDGDRLRRGLVTTLPGSMRLRAARLLRGSWETLGRYFRGQLLVALVDAVFIGLGLVLLGVPLALPLSVLIFFGGLFPIVGAITTGTLAILVALADDGLTTGLIVLGLVIAVQQLESNVLEPLILGRVIALHPLVIVLSITAGSLLLGILGAFLAVPVAAIIARIIEDQREDDPSDRVDPSEADARTLDRGGRADGKEEPEDD